MPALDAATRRFAGLATGQRSLVRLVGLTVAAFALFSVLSPDVFFSTINFETMGYAIPEIGLLGLAIMIAFVTGGIDLSVVSIANLTALTTATLFAATDATDATGGRAALLTVAFVAAGMVVAVLAGLVNGFLVAVIGITPILATLGTMQLYNGLAIVWTGGKALYGMPDVFLSLGVNTVAGIPVSFLAFALIALIIAVMLNRTPLGTQIRLVGANPTAARFSGIANRRVLLSTYVVTGLLAGVAGVIIAARSASASADYGSSYVLLAIVIAVLGGTNPNGGYGTVLGVVLATVTLQIVSSGFNIMRLSSFLYTIAQGVLLVAVMVLEVVLDRRRARTRGRPSPGATPGRTTPGQDAAMAAPVV
jgi:simple sugar transport system permease protein